MPNVSGFKYPFIGNKMKTVNTMTDFPAPSVGVITLDAGITYVISDNITTSDRFVLGEGTSIQGLSLFSPTLTYTGVGTMFTGVDVTTSCVYVNLDAPSGKVWDISDTVGGLQTILLHNVFVNSCDSVADFDDLFDVDIQTFGVASCAQGIVVSGVNWSIFSLSRIQMVTTNLATFKGVDLGSSVHQTLEFSDLSFTNTNASAFGITGLASNGNVTAGHIATVSSCSFRGGMTSLENILSTDARWDFSGTSGIPNSQNSSHGELYGCPLTNSTPVLTAIPATTYNPVLTGDRILTGTSTNITTISKTTGTGLTLNLGAAVTAGAAVRPSTLVVGSGYGADGVTTGVATTGGTGTGCTVDITVEGGKVKYIRINAGGSAYTTTDVLTIVGGTGSTFVVAKVDNGRIQSVTVNAGGTGYVLNQCVSISTGNKNAIVKITNVSAGVVQAGGATLLFGGSGYTGAATNQATTTISGFIVDVDGDGVYKIDSTVSFSDSTSSAHLIKGVVSIAKTTRRIRLENGTFVRTIASSNIANSGFSAYVTAVAGDFLYYEFENGHSAATTLTLQAFEWVMFKV